MEVVPQTPPLPDPRHCVWQARPCCATITPMSMRKILAFGNPVYDDITTPALSTAGRVLSGCATNGCLVLARLGYHTTLVGRVGADYHQRFLSDMQRYQITPSVELAEQTAGFRLVYDAHGNRTLDVLGVAGIIEHVPASCADADAIIIGPILQETPHALIARIRQYSNAPLFLDPQGLLRRLDSSNHIEHYPDPSIQAIAPLCEVIKANELETLVLTGIDPRLHPHLAVERLHALGCRIAIMTLAEAGSYISNGAQTWAVPAYTTDARDPTGAGDTYMAGFLHAYLFNPDDLFAAGCSGAATASLWIERTGPDAPIQREEVARRTDVLLQHHIGVL